MSTSTMSRSRYHTEPGDGASRAARLECECDCEYRTRTIARHTRGGIIISLPCRHHVVADYALGCAGGDRPISWFYSFNIRCRFLCVICTSARFHEPVLCVRPSVRPAVTGSRTVARIRHESSRVLFVTLNKSETYKETIVRVLVRYRNRSC